MKKDDKNSRPLKLGLHLPPDTHGRYQCVAQLLLNQAVVFFLLFAAAFSCGASLCVLKIVKLA